MMERGISIGFASLVVMVPAVSSVVDIALGYGINTYHHWDGTFRENADIQFHVSQRRVFSTSH